MNPVGTFRREAHVPVNTDKIVGSSRLLGERRHQILVRDGKGAKDRVTLLPPRWFSPSASKWR